MAARQCGRLGSGIDHTLRDGEPYFQEHRLDEFRSYCLRHASSPMAPVVQFETTEEPIFLRYGGTQARLSIHLQSGSDNKGDVAHVIAAAMKFFSNSYQGNWEAWSDLSEMSEQKGCWWVGFPLKDRLVCIIWTRTGSDASAERCDCNG